MRIANNIMALNTHRSYTINNDKVAASAEKLSSGYRINRAGDDAAGLAISEKSVRRSAASTWRHGTRRTLFRLYRQRKVRCRKCIPYCRG